MSKTEKTGRVPKLAPTGYRAGTTEDPRFAEGLKGHEKNDVVTIAPSPKTSDRESSKPSMGLGRKKDDSHGHEYPGRSYEVQTVKAAVAKPRDKEVVENETGSNQRLGN